MRPNSFGGSGGGSVAIAARSIKCDGGIYANGMNAPSPEYYSIGAAGSGGSILLRADSLWCSGKLQAEGGKDLSTYGQSNGGGGRIAIDARIFRSVIDSIVSAKALAPAQNGTIMFIMYPFAEHGVVKIQNLSNLQAQYYVKIDENNHALDENNFEIKNGFLAVNGDHTLKTLRCENGVLKLFGNFMLDSIYVSGTSGSMTGTYMVNGDAKFLNGTHIGSERSTLLQENRMSLFVGGKIALDASSRINVIGCGYLGDQMIDGVWVGARTLGNRPGATCGNSWDDGAGGSYGGKGTVNGSGVTNQQYGDFLYPTDLGSGGATNHLYPSNYGGNGGGAIYMRSRSFDFNGAISSIGEGNGSGGSILVVSDTITGTPLSIDVSNWGLGGGGRAALYAEKHLSINIEALSNSNSLGLGTSFIFAPPQDSTVYILATPLPPDTTCIFKDGDTLIEDKNLIIGSYGSLQIIGNHHFKSIVAGMNSQCIMSGDIEVDSFFMGANSQCASSGNIKADSIHIAANTSFSVKGYLDVGGMQINGGMAIIDGPINSSRDIVVSNNGTLTRPQDNDTSPDPLIINCAGAIKIDNTSSISVANCGYEGAKVQDGIIIPALSFGGTFDSSSAPFGFSGGSYAGTAATWGDGSKSNAVYGNFYQPFENGSGGGLQNINYYYQTKAGNGGGIVRITAKSMEIQGSVLSDGESSPAGGGGSGGAIWISVSDSITGIGKVSSNGGSGARWVGGSGGRIALYASAISPSLLITAYGGEGSSAGTIFLQDSSRKLGVLKIANRNRADASNTTPLIGIGEGHITGISSDTLIDENALFSRFINDHFVKPRYDYVNLSGAFRVNSSDAHFLVVDTTEMDLRSHASIGDKYIGVYQFDTVIISGGAQASIPGLVFYNAMVLDSGAFTSFAGTQTGAGIMLIHPSVENGAVKIQGSINSPIKPCVKIYENDHSLDGNSFDVQNAFLFINGDHQFKTIKCQNGFMNLVGTIAIDSIYLSKAFGSIAGRLTVNGDADFLNETRMGSERSTLLQENRMNIIVGGRMKIDATSSINADGCGYLGDQMINGEWIGARTVGNHIGAICEDCWNNRPVCASYGGKGADNGAGFSNPQYGDFLYPTDLGSGGATCHFEGNNGGSGGGAIFIKTRSFNLNGHISSNGEYAGSGGSILVEADSIIGTPRDIAVNGGQAGGGGGRAALYANNYLLISIDSIPAPAENEGTIFIFPPRQDSAIYVLSAPLTSDNITPLFGDNDTLLENKHLILGTVQIKGIHHSKSIVCIKNSLCQLSDTMYGDTVYLPLNSNLLFQGLLDVGGMQIDGGRATINGQIHCRHNISVSNNGTITHSPADDANTNSLTINCEGTISIDNTSSITVADCGYPGARYEYGFIPAKTYEGVPEGTIVAGEAFAGGSYGGNAGVWSNSSSNAVYGDFYSPNENGSGGGTCWYWTRGGKGGGMMRLIAKNIAIEGSLQADGESPDMGGGGSGGSIWISASDSINGSGTISSNGGYGTLETGGSGGRIALYASAISPSLSIFAYGGEGGSAGTIFLRDSTRTAGVLKIDNNDMAGNSNSTPLLGIGEGHITGLSADTLIDTNAIFSPFVKGHLVKPRYDYVSPSGAFFITSTDTHTLVVDTSERSLMSSASVGDDYIGVYQFDSVIVEGGAQASLPGLVFYNAMVLNNGSFTSFSGTIKQQFFCKLTD
jgi:hypothetical protein